MKVTQATRGGCSCTLVSELEHFDINKIFDCGQCFRFERVESSEHELEFSGVAHGRFVSFAQDSDTLYIYGSSIEDFENIWRQYLDLDRDYGAVAADILDSNSSPALAAAVEYGRGIRILRQDPVECIISFIISQNNNIPRIKKIIEALCLRCGERLELSEGLLAHAAPTCSLCTFPDVSALRSLGIDGLFELKTGFRAKYIFDAAERLASGELCVEGVFAESDIEAAIDLLCQVKGIGRKVASCALLFGFGKYNAFPVDVWMKRVAEKYFPEQGGELSWEQFGRYAGIAQQYLFYYERYHASKIQ